MSTLREYEPEWVDSADGDPSLEWSAEKLIHSGKDINGRLGPNVSSFLFLRLTLSRDTPFVVVVIRVRTWERVSMRWAVRVGGGEGGGASVVLSNFVEFVADHGKGCYEGYDSWNASS